MEVPTERPSSEPQSASAPQQLYKNNAVAMASEAPSPTGPSNRRICWTCRSPSHISYRCPRGAESRIPRACYSCGSRDHLIHECPYSTKSRNAKTHNTLSRSVDFGVTQPSTTQTTITQPPETSPTTIQHPPTQSSITRLAPCWGCGNTGHRLHSCPVTCQVCLGWHPTN
jgi:hypothetical protein